ncbi:MAG: DUF1778 domain-containing protein [Spirochaetaceae bacterium]|nr:DUF1778 domain-containing protein [Spirochaetaceae bacterium]
MSTGQTKTERVQVRIDPVAKQRLERAAALANTTVSAFVVNHALEAANHMIQEHGRLVLNDADWTLFFDALCDPPEPNEVLKQAFATHRQLISRPAGS